MIYASPCRSKHHHRKDITSYQFIWYNIRGCYIYQNSHHWTLCWALNLLRPEQPLQKPVSSRNYFQVQEHLFQIISLNCQFSIIQLHRYASIYKSISPIIYPAIYLSWPWTNQNHLGSSFFTSLTPTPVSAEHLMWDAAVIWDTNMEIHEIQIWKYMRHKYGNIWDTNMEIYETQIWK